MTLYLVLHSFNYEFIFGVGGSSTFDSNEKGGILQSNAYPSSRSILNVPLKQHNRTIDEAVININNKLITEYIPHMATCSLQTHVTTILKSR